MNAIKKILFPLDFSDRCLGAARYVEALAGRFDAEIMLLHVVDRGEHAPAEELWPGRKKKLDSFLAEEFQYFKTRRVCVLGDPAGMIAETARNWSPDLVMMPTHGLGFFDRPVLGSVTARMLRELDHPLWTGVHSEAAPPLEQIHCRKILCALDLGYRSRRVLEWADFLAAEYQAELMVLHAVPEMVAVAAGGRPSEEVATASSLADARNRIEGLQAAVGTSASAIVESGDAAEIVVRTAQQFGADLLVAGRSHAGLYGYLYQHLYSIVSEAPCPVLSL